ncbi:MAG: branched-chain amino acid ABC transporter permease [Acidobacteriota bacterium]|nr:branched-chain amino acid ABC transporter permease [Acidobacteriota bacterium]
MDWSFFAEVLIGGLLAGVMYSLVALGFVLIYKASGVLNFAQGAMVFLAALIFVTFVEKGWRFPLAAAVALAAMILLAVLVERLVLRPLVNQPPIALFLATIGLTFLIEGTSQGLLGAQAHGLEIGIPDVPFQLGSVNVSQFDLFAAGVAGVLVAALGLFFSRTRIGRALRAVGDDHQAALAVGIPLEQIWVIVWAAAGFVALVAGVLWGSRTGVQFSLTFVALKALPVLILGGFTSIPGAIVGGLLIGASEKLAEIYLGPHIGSGLENWFPYALATVFLLIRPEGLFGEKRIERV